MKTEKEYITKKYLTCVINSNYYTNKDGSPSNQPHVKNLIEDHEKFQEEYPFAFLKTAEEDVMVLPHNEKNSESSKTEYSILLTSFIDSYKKDNKVTESNIDAFLIPVKLGYRTDKKYEDIIKKLEEKKNKYKVSYLEITKGDDIMLELEMDVNPDFLYFVVIIIDDKKKFCTQPITNRSLKQYSRKRPQEGLNEDRLNSNKKRPQEALNEDRLNSNKKRPQEGLNEDRLNSNKKGRKEESYLASLKAKEDEGTLYCHYNAIFDEENKMRNQLLYQIEVFEITDNIINLKNSTISNVELSQILKEMKEKKDKSRNNGSIIVLEEFVFDDKIPIDIVIKGKEIYLSYNVTYLINKYELSKDCKSYLFNDGILKSKFCKSGEKTIKFELNIINQEKFIEQIEDILKDINKINENPQNFDSSPLKVFSFVSTQILN